MASNVSNPLLESCSAAAGKIDNSCAICESFALSDGRTGLDPTCEITFSSDFAVLIKAVQYHDHSVSLSGSRMIILAKQICATYISYEEYASRVCALMLAPHAIGPDFWRS